MLTILGNRHRFCDGVSRRNFLKIGAFGAGLTLADLLRGKAAGADAGPTKTPRDKAAILIWLPGGPSHIDMYDLKPDAPAEFRGEFKPIQTNVPGFDICELMPMQAKIADKLALLRSCAVREDNGHNDAEVTTGYCRRINLTEHHPSMGSVVSKLRAGSADGVPPYVNLRDGPVVALDGPIGIEPGFLGMAHRPFTPRGPDLENLRPAKGVSPEQFNDRRALLAGFDRLRRDIDAGGAMQALDAFTARAFDMVASGAVRKALDPLAGGTGHAGTLQGRRAVPDRTAACGSGRRLRNDVVRDLGHPRRQLHAAQEAAAAIGSGLRQLGRGPA
jgi:hypothetical protein